MSMNLIDAPVFNYDRIPLKFRLGVSPTDAVTVFRGAERGKELDGMASHAVEKGNTSEIERAREIMESGDEEAILKLFDAHTSFSSSSPLLSVTFNPELAQVFAPTERQRSTSTVYELRVPVSRCVYDTFDTGYAGASGEIFVLGIIHPGEISAVKINNDTPHSELETQTMEGTSFIRRKPERDSSNRTVKHPKNWRRVR